MGLDVLYGLLHSGDFFRFFVRDLAFKFLFQRHHQLHRIQRIGTKIIDERRLVLYFSFVNTQLFGNNFLNALLNVFNLNPLLFLWWSGLLNPTAVETGIPIFYKLWHFTKFALIIKSKPKRSFNPCTCHR